MRVTVESHPRSTPGLAAVAATLLLFAVPTGVLAAPSATLTPDDPARAGALAFLESLETTYEHGETDGFVALLTPDYRFFSPDEGILRRFPGGFTREDERQSHARLFTGGTNSEGRFLPRALAVDVEFLDTEVCPDPEHPGDAGHAVVHVRRACLTIRFADGNGMQDAAPHEFWLVRTDEGWRCRRWVERPAPGEPLLATRMGPGHGTRDDAPWRGPAFPSPALAGAAVACAAVLGTRRRRG